MWQIAVLCSGCGDEYEVTVDDLDDVEHEACPCGYSLIVLSVAAYEQLYGAQAAAPS
jgi:hypothetical protein